MPSADRLLREAHEPLNPNKPQTYELRDRQDLEQPHSASPRPKHATNAPTNEDYEPQPSRSIPLSPDRQRILDAILRLYSGSATHDKDSSADNDAAADLRVYAQAAIYDDVWSYCDTRYKIAGQWYGIPVVMQSSKTLAVEIVESSQAISGNDSGGTPSPDRPAAIVFKMKRAWTPRGLLGKTFEVNHFVTLSLGQARTEDGEGPAERVKYHKDQWNEKDYSHAGIGKIFKTLNGKYATLATQPPKDL